MNINDYVLRNTGKTFDEIQFYTYNLEEFSMEIVEAKGLYTFLNIQLPFDAWFSTRVNQYGFKLGTDYFVTNVNSEGYIESGNEIYLLTVDMAKKLSMAETSEVGCHAHVYIASIESSNLAANFSVEYNV